MILAYRSFPIAFLPIVTYCVYCGEKETSITILQAKIQSSIVLVGLGYKFDPLQQCNI